MTAPAPRSASATLQGETLRRVRTLDERTYEMAEQLAGLHASHEAIQQTLASIQKTLGGDGSRGSSLPERMAASETHIAGLQSAQRWAMAKALALTILTALGSTLGLKATVGL